jgi:hypothetical protein
MIMSARTVIELYICAGYMANHGADKSKLCLIGIGYFRAMIFVGHILLQMSEITLDCDQAFFQIP